MVEYPDPCPFGWGPRRAAIQQRPPRHNSLLFTRCRPSPCDRLSRSRSTTAAPPRPGVNSGRCACPPPCWSHGGEGDGGSFPTFTVVRYDRGGVQLYPDGVARPSNRSLGTSPHPTIGYGQTGRRGHRIRHPPLPQCDPSTRFDGSLTTHGASTADSVSLHLSVVASGHEPSGGTDPSLRCQGCSQPHPQPADAACPQLQPAACDNRRRASQPARSNSASWRTAEFVDYEHCGAGEEPHGGGPSSVAGCFTTPGG